MVLFFMAFAFVGYFVSVKWEELYKQNLRTLQQYFVDHTNNCPVIWDNIKRLNRKFKRCKALLKS